MTSRSFDLRNAAIAFAKMVSKENNISVRLIERNGKYFVEGDYHSTHEISITNKSSSSFIEGQSESARPSTNIKIKKKIKIPLKEQGLKTLKERLQSSVMVNTIANRRKIDNAHIKLLKERQLLNSIENREATPPIEKNVTTYTRGTVVNRVAEKRGNTICPLCGGDGGVNGGCVKCDGTGWI